MSRFLKVWALIWCAGIGIFCNGMTAGPAWAAGEGAGEYTVKVKQLVLRQGPGNNYPAQKYLKKGDELTATAQKRKGWWQVQHADGSRGWVPQRHLQKVTDEAKPLKAPRLAQEKKSRLSPKPLKEAVANPAAYNLKRPAPKAIEDQMTLPSDWEGKARSPLELAILRYIEDEKSKKRMSAQDHLYLVVEDLSTNRRVVSINATEQVKAASLIKVPVYHAYMLQRFRKQLQHTAALQQHLVRMIHFSNNYSTNVIMKTMGGPHITERILQGSGFYHQMEITEYIPEDGRTYHNKISAEDLNRLFVHLWKGNLLGPQFSEESNQQATEEMLKVLGMPRGVRDRLKEGTCFASDSSAKVWDKTGFVRGLNGNAGIIEIGTRSGRRAYSIATIIDRPNYESIPGSGQSWASRQSRLIRKLSEITYAYFKTLYGDQTSCGKDKLLFYATNIFGRDSLQM